MQGIGKSFGPVRVLEGVDFSVAGGEIHAIMGENGAGKSTLMKILSGAYSADSGRILIDGEVVTIRSTREAEALRIAILGIPGSSAARERGEGFESALAGKPGVKLVARQPADFNRAQSLTVMENILQANKSIQGVFAQNDEMALGAQRAIEEAGLKDVVIIGFDATPDALAAVKAGKLAATVQQKPDLIGKMGVDTAKLLIDGKPVERNIPVPLALVTQ